MKLLIIFGLLMTGYSFWAWNPIMTITGLAIAFIAFLNYATSE